MQNDEVIWHVINKHFCCFKKKTDKEDLCSNAYNVTGKCNRVSCPLANSNYGTVMEQQGRLYLLLKTVERAHLPSRLWERIKLPRSVSDAKKTIELHMKNVYPKHQLERCKKRVIKLRQMLDRMRRLELKPKEKLEGVKKKTERREAAREKKALNAAHIEDVIEDELLKRLHQGVYGDLYEEHRLPAAAETATQAEEEAAEVTQEKAAESGAIRFEAAAEAEEDSASGSEFDSDFDLDSESGSSDGFEFSDSDSDEEDEGKQPEKRKKGIHTLKNETVDMEDLDILGEVQKRRREASQERREKPAVPMATLRRQVAKKRNTRMRIEYEPELETEEA
ncbi:hypothetical protein Efla_002352 [Eimeria flavescens]